MMRGRADGPRRYSFPRTARITASGEIRALFRRGRRKRTRHLDVFISSSPVAHSRVGLVVPKHRHNVVERNLRLKRRLREAVRLELLPRLQDDAAAYDVLFRARPEAYETSYEQLRQEVVQVAEELCYRSS